MADTKKYILRAVGPASKLMGLQPDSVSLDELGGGVPMSAGRLTPHTHIQIQKLQRYRWSQGYVNYGVIPTKVADFVFHWAPWDDTTLILASTGLSCLGDIAIVPQSVSASVSRGEPRPAMTTLEAYRLSASPTWGTTAGTPATDDHQFILGPSTFNNVALGNLIGQTVNFGIAVDTHIGKSGSLLPVWPFAIQTYLPEIVFETEDLGLVKDYINAPVELATNAAVVKFANETGTAGYAYTMSKAEVRGSIKGDTGTLRLRMLDGSTWSAAAY